MHGIILTALLLAGPAQVTRQTAAAATPGDTVMSSKGKVPEPAKTETPSGPVITIHGMCEDTKSKESVAACATTVSRAQFDGIIRALEAIGPPLLPEQRRMVAEGYAKTLVTYEQARAAGVERDPRFAEVLKLARMRAMGDMYNALMAEKAAKVTPQQIEAYYKEHPANFEELIMRRIAVPRHNTANLEDKAFDARARKIAEEMHERAAKGEDMDKLEKEAMAALAMTNPPKTLIAPVRRGMYVAEQENELFALKPGEVSKIVEQPSTFIIFRLESRKTLSLADAKEEIRQTLVKQNKDKQEESTSNAFKVEFDDKYLGPAPPSAWRSMGEVNRGQQKPAAVQSAQTTKK